VLVRHRNPGSIQSLAQKIFFWRLSKLIGSTPQQIVIFQHAFMSFTKEAKLGYFENNTQMHSMQFARSLIYKSVDVCETIFWVRVD
jgi:hypothetical protein